jgi:outer membrane receptor protein involved in Fe transport
MSSNRIRSSFTSSRFQSIRSRPIALAVVLAIASFSSWAQETAADTSANKKDTKTLDSVIVTGSHIRRVEVETASPVITIDRQRIEDSGKPTVGDLLQSLPAMAGFMPNTAMNSGFSHGRALVSLRNLGPERTLVLVNGHRMAGPASSVSAAPGVDVNAIPAAMIERIEVLTDGASSIYGSDAIGGVVNIILKDKYDGFAATADYAESGHGDGNRRNVGVEWGKTWSRGNLIMGLSHNSMNALYNRDRDFASSQWAYNNGVVSPMFGRNSRAVLSDGSVWMPNSNLPAGMTSASDFHPYNKNNPGDTYNYYGAQYLITPVKRTNFSLHGTYRLTDSVQAYMDMFWTRSTTHSRLAAYGIDMGSLTSSLDQNYYNPFGSQLSDYYLRLPAVFTRNYVSTMSQTNVVTGLRGSFGDSSWQWDASLGYAHYKDKLVRYGFSVTSELANAVGASFLDGDGSVKCGTAGNVIANCTPANIFNQDDPATIAALRKTLLPVDLMDQSTMKTAEISTNGDLFGLPAGQVQGAFGMVWRKNDFAQGTHSSTAAADPFGQCDYMDGCIMNQGHAETVKEAYVEFQIPVLKDLPLVSALNLNVGSRYSNYSAWGGTANSKVALEWRPVSDLLVRATGAQVFRAPALGDLYGSPFKGVLDNTQYNDPCAGYTGGANAGSCANVPTNGSFTNTSSLTVLTTGSANAGWQVKPESGRTYDIGMVYDPHWLEGFSINLDAWRVRLKDMLSGTDQDYVLAQCYRGDARFCKLIQRDGSGQLVSITVPYAINYNGMNTSGYDLGLQYALPWQRYGTFHVGLDATFMRRYRIDGDDHNYVGETSSYGNLPRWRSTLNLAWDYGNWHAGWAMRYIGKSTVGSYHEGICFNTAADGSCVYFGVPSVVYHNVSLSRKIPEWHTTLSFGIDNLTDKHPPIYYGYYSNAANTDASTYDTMGRYFWGRVRVEF